MEGAIMSSRQNFDEQAEAVLALAAGVLRGLDQSDRPKVLLLSDGSLEATLRHFACAEANFSSIRRQLDNEGTKLWNACLQSERGGRSDEYAVLMCKVRTLAYVMLNCAAPRTTLGHYRSLELAFQTIKACLEQQLDDLSQKMMEVAASRLDMLERANVGTEPDSRLEAITTEYYTLRIHLAWSQRRSDIADHLFSKIPKAKTQEQQAAIVDICYTIGDKLLSSGQYEAALVWLNRALTLCEPREGSNLEQGMKQKRLLILHASAYANLYTAATDLEENSGIAIELLRKEFGGQFAAIALFLEHLNKKETIDQELFDTLESAIKTMGGNETSIKIVYHYLVKLRDRSLELFVKACGQLLARLSTWELDSKRQWMEKLFISNIWVLTSTDHRDPFLLAETAACQLMDNGLDELSEENTNVSLMLIWKCIDKLVDKGLIDIAEKWCCFALNLKQPIFHLTPDAEAKFFRKWIFYAVDKPGLSAQRIFDAVPDGCKSCPLTLYLLYRLALYVKDCPRATFYLKSLGEGNAEFTYIQACMSDAVQAGRVDIALQSLGGLINDLDGDCNLSEISQLVQHLVDAFCKPGALTEHLEDAVYLLESLSCKETKLLSAPVLHWLAQRSYNIALDIHGTAAPEVVCRLLNVANQFIGSIEPETSIELIPNPVDIHLHCTYLQATINIREARGKESPELKANHYNEAREAIKRFNAWIQLLSVDDQVIWLDKHRCTLSFDFEAAVSLHQWQELRAILETSKPIIDSKLASIFLDCVLQSEGSSSCVSRAVKQMIRTLHSSPLPYLNTSNSSFSETLPQYFHILFTLSHQGKEFVLAESVVDQALSVIRDNPNTQSQYPREELEWLATSAFNLAVDFFSDSADEICQRWGKKAIALADCVRDKDQGRLGSLLRMNFAKLQAS